ncbi:MAG TPA: hypothetical protein VIT38_17325 [Allosphingosinicella sp.]
MMRLAFEDGDELQIAAGADIRGVLARLQPIGPDTFAILSRADEDYVQTMMEKDGCVIEKREGRDDAHFRATRPSFAPPEKVKWWQFGKRPQNEYFTLAETEEVFASYADGREPPLFVQWVKMDVNNP